VRVPYAELGGREVRFSDWMSPAVYDRRDVVSTGLFLDMPAWGYHVFDARAI
jgi:hypothetical protein